MSHPLQSGLRVEPGRGLTAFRRACQIGVLLLLALTPVLGLHAVGVDTRWDPAELELRYGPLAPAAAELAHRTLGDPAEGLPGAVVGSTWSIRIGGLELTDPLAAATLILAGGSPTLLFLFGALLVVAVHVLLGRFFCGFLCPYGTLSRLVHRVRAPLVRRGLLPTLRIPAGFRFALLAALLVAPLAGASLTIYALPYLSVGRAMHGLVFGGAASATALVGAFLLLDLLVTDHGTCRSVCPSGALQHLLGRWRALRLTPARGVQCDHGCDDCLGACWLGLDPRAALVDPDCDGCLRCGSSCPPTRLGLLLGAPRKWKGTPPVLVTIGAQRPRPARKATPRGAAAGVALLAGVGLVAGVGSGLAGCAGGSPPTVVAGVATWNSPFMAPAEPHRAAVVRMEATTWNGLAFEGGLAYLPDGDRVGVRVYVEEEPGTPWTGPLRIEVTTATGAVQLGWAAPSSPRSVVKPALYEGLLVLRGPATITALDGPTAGASVRIAGAARRSPWPAVPAGLVAVAFLGGLVLQGRRPRTSP